MSSVEQISYDYDEITRRVARHFKDADELGAYFAASYQNPGTTSASPATRERYRRAEEHPAVVAFADLITLRNFLADLANAIPDGNGDWRFSLGRDEARAVWHAATALGTIARSPQGTAILFTLAGLVPRKIEPKPAKLVSRIRKLIENDAHLKELNAVFDAHHAN